MYVFITLIWLFQIISEPFYSKLLSDQRGLFDFREISDSKINDNKQTKLDAEIRTEQDYCEWNKSITIWFQENDTTDANNFLTTQTIAQLTFSDRSHTRGMFT